jgi:hypothetical protein
MRWQLPVPLPADSHRRHAPSETSEPAQIYDLASVPVMGFAGASFIGLATANIGFVVRASVPISGW